MKLHILGVAFFALAAPMFGQQSTTNTNCMVNGQLVNCTSITNATQPTVGWLGTLAAREKERQKQKDESASQPQTAQQSQISPEAVKELLTQEKAERDAKDTVDFMYCRQNPKASVTDSDGKAKSCSDVITYTKAFCSVNPNDDRCTLARSKAEVEQAFAAAAAAYTANKRRAGNEEYFADKFAKLTKWGCMSFPDMVLPQRDGTMHPCPDAPEIQAK